MTRIRITLLLVDVEFACIASLWKEHRKVVSFVGPQARLKPTVTSRHEWDPMVSLLRHSYKRGPSDN